MYKTIISIVISLAIGYLLGAQPWDTKEATPVSNNANLNLETPTTQDTLLQERMLLYRAECQDEWQGKLTTVDNFVQSDPNITGEQAKNLAISAGIADSDGYILDDDVWIKECIDKKIEIFE